MRYLHADLRLLAPQNGRNQISLQLRFTVRKVQFRIRDFKYAAETEGIRVGFVMSVYISTLYLEWSLLLNPAPTCTKSILLSCIPFLSDDYLIP